MIPAMKKSGYSPGFSAAVTAVASTIGGIIPPSIAIVLFASVTNQSVGKLFSAGILPGIVVGLLFMLICYVLSVRRNYERYDAPFNLGLLVRTFARAILALILPLVLYFGIVGGVFTPTEAGAVVCGMAFILGKYVYKTLTWARFWAALERTARLTAAIFLIIAAAGPFSWLLTLLGALEGLENWLISFEGNLLLFLVAFLAVIIVAGMLADIVANLIILGPTLLAAAQHMGVSDTQASMAICVGFLLGTVTPPVGICYFTAARLAEEKLERVAVALMPFILAEILLLVLIFMVPALTGLIPRLAGFG